MVDEPADHLLRELAADGVWTQRQLAARLARWALEAPARYLTQTVVLLRPTGWSHRRVRVTVVRPSEGGDHRLRGMGVRAQQIRPEELEHGVGLAELRWQYGIPAERYRAQDVLGRDHRRAIARGGVGLGPAVADGVYEMPDGVVLCEYDHGRYTSRRILAKLGAFRSATRLDGKRIVGTVWGAPTERRAARLRSLGAGEVLVVPPERWLG